MDDVKLSDITLHDPTTRFVALLLGMVVTVGGGVMSATWLVRGAIDDQVSEFRQHDVALSNRIDALTATMRAETETRKATEASVQRTLRQSEDSRRAEENGIVQRIDGLGNRIDTLIQRQQGFLGPRGDITSPPGMPWNDGSLYGLEKPPG